MLWEAPKDLRTAVEDVVVFLTYLQKRHRNLHQGATAQLLVMCNGKGAPRLPRGVWWWDIVSCALATIVT